MLQVPFATVVKASQAAMAVVLLACTLPFFIISWRWPLVGDASLIHYICFLIDRGMAPYRDLGDMNMPAAFLIERAAMHTFGGGDHAWRLFDFFILALASGAIVWIAGRRDWFAGLYAACLFILAHGRDGFAQAGQRDLVLAVNLLVATAMLFAAVRHRRPWLAAGFGLFAGLASSVKPTALPLALVLLALAALALRRRHVRLAPYLGTALLAGLAAPLASLVFLLRQHALRAFLDGLRTVVPFYVSLGHRPFGYLLLHSLSPLLPLVLLWAATLTLTWPAIPPPHPETLPSFNPKNQSFNPKTRSSFPNAGGPASPVTPGPQAWERLALLSGALFGLVSYLVQARGFPYYRYTLLAFLLPLMALDFTAPLRASATSFRGRCVVATALAGLAVGALWIAPASTLTISRFDPGSIDFIASLQANLDRLGGPALDRDVQCIDSVSGCGTVLYRMRLVQSTGVLSDFLLFGSSATPADAPQPPVVEQTRAYLAEALRLHPPRVIVVTSWLHIDGPGEYRKLDRWPAFAAFLQANYTVAATWTPTRPERWWSRPVWSNGYRIYLRK